MKLLVATRNQGKVKEIMRMLQDLPLEVLTLEDFPEAPQWEETGSTFEENAAMKATALAAHSGCLTLADDSGLEVDYLGGAPGVYSARFAGEKASDGENNQKLLSLLAGVPWEKRQARFRCVMALADPEGNCRTAEGICEGVIAFCLRGENGFGYDPLFYLPDAGKTMAELTLEEKNRISHRARALQKMREIIAETVLGKRLGQGCVAGE